MKIGRTNDMDRRYSEHRRHCSLLQPTLIGYFPSGGESQQDLAAGRLNAVNTTASSHLLERVVHKELTEIATHAPYLSPNGTTGGMGLGAAQTRIACPSCESFSSSMTLCAEGF